MKGIGNSTRVDVVQAKTTPQHVRINANGHGRHGEQKVKEELQLFCVCKKTKQGSYVLWFCFMLLAKWMNKRSLFIASFNVEMNEKGLKKGVLVNKCSTITPLEFF